MARSATVTGDRQLRRTLARLDDKVQKKLLRQAVQASSKPVVKAARNAAPVETGTLKRSIGVKMKIYKRQATAMAIVGPRTGFGFTDDDGVRHDPANYGHLVEGGTVYQGAQPFVRPALHNHRGAINAALRNKLSAGIKKAATSKT
jgi:HK97 gp10 family phage protein